MIVEFGHFCLILALVVSCMQVFQRVITIRTAIALCGLCSAALLSLIWAYVTSDFSVLNVAQNSHTLKPLLYKISGAWANHEGSMLLWIFMLALFGMLVAVDKSVWPSMKAPVLRVQGLISAGFIAFTLFTSNPFERLPIAPMDGQDLNPLLQDPGLAFHPPLLYMGYVGFSVVFAFGVAALLTGRLDKRWANWVKPWILLSWSALTAGIALGSWWAYYELGWGGWWFWDPVENASLMPWLLGTALLHSVSVLQKRGALKRWTILLAILTFSFSILGTFLVRSGVLTSVHAFAVDPARGLFILGLFAFYTGGALIIYASRVHQFKSGKLFEPLSRESMLVLNNLFLVTAAATILIGTLYPLILSALDLGQISVGPPYFHYTFVPLMVPLIILMGIAPSVSWKKDDKEAVMQRIGMALTATMFLIVIAWGTTAGKPMGAIFGFAIGAWLFCASLWWWGQRVRIFQGDMWARMRHLPRAQWGMSLAHAGLGLAIIGMVGTGLWVKEDLRVMTPGQQINIGSYSLTFNGVEPAFGKNFTAIEGNFTAQRNDSAPFTLNPQKRSYPIAQKNTTEAAIRKSFWDDIYIALGQPESNGAWVVRVYVHPLVPFLWLGFMMIVLGGIISFSGSRKALKT
jgi:cytochrome c-type biogenesis protein CcmF